MRFKVLYQGSELRLSLGQFLIGRSPDCAIVLPDPLVSRHHALLHVFEEALTIEDLGSRNGVVLNGEPIVGRRGLFSGDSISIAGQTLAIGHVLGGLPANSTTTARVSAYAMLEVLGNLADKALALGRGDEAERLLAVQLESLLTEARTQGRPDNLRIDKAIEYAARLASANKDGRWVSYIFSLFTALEESCPATILDELYAVAGRIEGTDMEAIANYIALHRSRVSDMSPRDRFLLRRVEGFEQLLRA